MRTRHTIHIGTMPQASLSTCTQPLSSSQPCPQRHKEPHSSSSSIQPPSGGLYTLSAPHTEQQAGFPLQDRRERNFGLIFLSGHTTTAATSSAVTGRCLRARTHTRLLLCGSSQFEHGSHLSTLVHTTQASPAASRQGHTSLPLPSLCPDCYLQQRHSSAFKLWALHPQGGVRHSPDYS